ncbi:glycosyltransferase [Paracoccus tibetensis]|uniref:Glycosyltransferase involved in cell wall bisynthesis n=1 Tax=Paracoccus tibetensis TaxID=336292 RepID=A0A1G5EIY1_9RHOB|nr:glycosyltransferase [Paracoccus tibetensis]SCY26915.1 Glycosyltransferase involved in cell wall bisynthesis [Paracoccus tibetensis]
MTFPFGGAGATAAPQDIPPVEADIRELRAIYERIFPTRHLRYVLRIGTQHHGPKVQLHEGEVDLAPGDLGPDFLGVIERPAFGSDPRIVTIIAALPRPPRPGQPGPAERPWKPIARLGWLFRASPMAYETLRYHAEMLRKRRLERRDRRRALPFGRRAALPAAAAPATRDTRPAILVGMHWLELGGAERLGLDCIHWAHRAGLRVFVVASVPAPQSLADRLPQHPGVTFIRLDRHLPHRHWTRYVTALALAEDIRLVHIHHCTPLYVALPTLRARLPHLQVIDSTHIVEYANGGFPWISGVWTQFIDRHHVISAGLARHLSGRFGVPLEKVLLGRMLDRDGPPPLPLRFRAGQPSLHVAFVGRLSYQKRPVVLAHALRELAAWARRRQVAFTATVIGDGPFNPAFETLLDRLGLRGQVNLLPPEADVPAILRQADMLLLPSNNEGLALVCYEAVAQGCIPVSTRVGAQDELLPDGLLVPLAPRATVRGITAVIDRLWRDAAFLAAQSEALARRHAALRAEPTAEEVLMPIYRRIAAAPATT